MDKWIRGICFYTNEKHFYVFSNRWNLTYLLPADFRISQIIKAMMAATINTPTQTPALKIPPITSHELKKIKNKDSSKN